MATFGNNLFANRFEHGAAFFGNMAAAGKFAFKQIRFELTEAILEFGFSDNSDSFHFYCGKSGSIRNPAACFELKKFNMAGGMSAATEFFADLRGRKAKFGENVVEQA